MKNPVLAICAALVALGSLPALAADPTDPWSQMLMKPMTAAETAQARAERDAAKAKWAALTPEEKAGVARSMRAKKLADLNAMEQVAQSNDLTAISPAESAQAKSDRQAAQAKYAQMTDEEKVAIRKAARGKRLSELNAMERVGQENDMKLYMSY